LTVGIAFILLGVCNFGLGNGITPYRMLWLFYHEVDGMTSA